MLRWLWPAAVLVYTAIIALFQNRAPWTLTQGLGDWLMLWFLFGMILVPALYFVLMIVAATVYNWIVIYTLSQRLLAIIGVVRGCILAGLAIWTRTPMLPLTPTMQVILTVAILAITLGLLLIGPADSRQGMDMLSGMLLTLVIAVIIVLLAPQHRPNDCIPAQVSHPCPHAHVLGEERDRV